MLQTKICKSKEDWLKSRQIGATDVAAILGIGKWRTTLDIYLKLTTGVEEEVEDNEAMKRGRGLEDYIRKMFVVDHSEYSVKKPPKDNWVFYDDTRPYLTGSLDGLLKERNGKKRKGILEIKTVDIKDKYTEEQWKSGTLPNQYYVQCLTYLAITKFDYCWLRAYIRYKKYENGEYLTDHYEMRDYYIEAKEKQDEIIYLLGAVDAFKQNYVDRKEIPPIKVI